ncbi:MAG: C13 family peptidase [Promethearchaeota archaeon]
MKSSHYKKLFFLMLVISLVTFGTNVSINNVESEKMMKNEPKTAVSANLAAWIIVAGDRSDHDKLDIIRSGCDQAYEALINRGFSAADIYYLDPSYATAGNPQSIYRDADTNIANIQWAIETWAPTRGVDASHGLGMYLFDHGGTGYMCIPGTDLFDTNLNTYLDNLESSSGCDRFIIVYEGCHAGSFINPISKDNRIILTATDITHGSYVNPAGDWATFSDGFWSSIIQCKTIGEAFEDAEAFVHTAGDGGIQFPWIDDNHDEIGHEVDAWGNLPNGGDGSDALNYWIGTGTNCPLILIAWLPLKYYINLSIFVIPVWAKVDTNDIMEKVTARLIPPNWTPPEIVKDDEGSIIGQHYLPAIQLYDQDGDGNYTGAFDRKRYSNFLTDFGDYKIGIFAKGQSGAMAAESTSFTQNEDGQAPPDTTPPNITITNPEANAGLKGIVNITAEGDDDQALDKIEILLDGVSLKSETMPPYYPYPEVVHSLDTADYSFGLHNITARAVDKASNIQETSILVTFERGDQIPGFQITTLSIATILGIITIYLIKIRKKRSELP